MTATEMATEVAERIKHESEKLKALELVTLPGHKKKPKKRSKLGMFTIAALCAGVGYAIFRSLRRHEQEPHTINSDVTDMKKPDVPDRTDGQRVAANV